jgi:hypothetical protein
MEIGQAAGAEVRDDGRVRWAIGNSPIDYFNCVAYADLTGEEADREITASIERLRAHDIPGSWHVGALDAPTRPRRASSPTASSTAATTSGWR